jgi:acetyl esterase/lipase
LVWTAEVNRFGWRSLLGREPGHPTLTAGVPARQATMAGLPPAWIGVGSIDLFVQEDIAYAERLIAAGVPAELNVVPGAYHAFQYFAPDTRLAKSFKASMLAGLQAALM